VVVNQRLTPEPKPNRGSKPQLSKTVWFWQWHLPDPSASFFTPNLSLNLIEFVLGFKCLHPLQLSSFGIMNLRLSSRYRSYSFHHTEQPAETCRQYRTLAVEPIDQYSFKKPARSFYYEFEHLCSFDFVQLNHEKVCPDWLEWTRGKGQP
jgi:hypothetical protein